MSQPQKFQTGVDSSAASGRRHATRELLLQALYQWHLNNTDLADLSAQFSVADGMRNADSNFFDDSLRGILVSPERLIAMIDPLLDRPWAQIDPVEKGILLLAAFEMSERLDIPYRVVINEAVDLAWQYGGAGSHKYVNGVLDKLAVKERSFEVNATKVARPK